MGGGGEWATGTLVPVAHSPPPPHNLLPSAHPLSNSPLLSPSDMLLRSIFLPKKSAVHWHDGELKPSTSASARRHLVRRATRLPIEHKVPVCSICRDSNTDERRLDYGVSRVFLSPDRFCISLANTFSQHRLNLSRAISIAIRNQVRSQQTGRWRSISIIFVTSLHTCMQECRKDFIHKQKKTHCKVYHVSVTTGLMQSESIDRYHSLSFERIHRDESPRMSKKLRLSVQRLVIFSARIGPVRRF
ncbi:hypothetical protein EVAR_62277_1 [Eumeta japonica]|uniref:Uncharacterized protein n=1 Tax=Eumeta variegata TaxID=151549 RepID=A0A4C1YZZ6_EUMVA|nr:hypothetical protein EVAR_62277_1 [Eumeta japonica]